MPPLMGAVTGIAISVKVYSKIFIFGQAKWRSQAIYRYVIFKPFSNGSRFVTVNYKTIYGRPQ
jgi:hypothetical protein